MRLLLQVLAILAVLAALFYFLRGCDSNSMENILPEAPRHIVPIDSTDIISDQDSIYQLVKNRLNILVKDTAVDIQTFAEDFKKAYPSQSYEILYYDDKTRRIQVKVPEQDREKLKKEIKTKLSRYELLIWDETLFISSRVPADPGFSSGDKSWHLETIKAYEAWEKSFGDHEIIIAIVDNGFDLKHPEFVDRTTAPYNVITRTSDVFTDLSEQHGTHVGGIAAGNKDNNAGSSGVAPNCKLMPIMVSDAQGLLSITAIIDGILYAVYNGADVINLSLGMKLNPEISNAPAHIQLDIIRNFMKDQEEFWNEIFEIANDFNCTIVMAGGNEDMMIGLDPMQRNESTIKVNALDRNLQRASFSNFGPYSTISAPGVHIYSSVPHNSFAYLDGTSMACPLVAGGVGLIKSHRPNITNLEIVTLLKNTALPLAQSKKEIGNLLQLDKALDIAKSNEPILDTSQDACKDISEQIAELEKRLNDLRNKCPDASLVIDTMKMPDTLTNMDFMRGTWKSTTPISNDENEELVLYFTFNGSNNVLLEIVEPDNNICDAICELDLGTKMFEIDQDNYAKCNRQGVYDQYYPYVYTCGADANGLVECYAQNKEIKFNRYTFNLIKTK